MATIQESNTYDIITKLLQGDMNRTNTNAKVVYLLQIVWHGEYDKAIEQASKEGSKRYFDSQFIENIKFLKESELWNQLSLQEKGNYIVECAREHYLICNSGFENLKLLIKENLPQAFSAFDDNFRGIIRQVITVGDGLFFKTYRIKEGVKYYIYGESGIVFNELEHAICYYLSPTYYRAISTLVNSDEKSPLFNKFDKE